MAQDKGTIPICPDLVGRRILVTGGSAGIGAATALAFDKNHCKVAVLGRRKDRLDTIVAQMQHGLAVVADLTGGDSEMQRAVQKVEAAFGGLDILVNSGGAFTAAMHGPGEEAYIAAMKLHVTGNLALIRAAEEELIKNKGTVINVSSGASRVPMPHNQRYGVAKAAQDALTKALAFEFAPKGVRINAILPAAIKTEVFETRAQQMNVTVDELMEKYAPFHAMGRVGVPDECAAAIVFLASNAASFITGVSLAVDGGALLGYWSNRTKWTG